MSLQTMYCVASGTGTEEVCLGCTLHCLTAKHQPIVCPAWLPPTSLPPRAPRRSHVFFLARRLSTVNRPAPTPCSPPHAAQAPPHTATTSSTSAPAAGSGPRGGPRGAGDAARTVSSSSPPATDTLVEKWLRLWTYFPSAQLLLCASDANRLPRRAPPQRPPPLHTHTPLPRACPRAASADKHKQKPTTRPSPRPRPPPPPPARGRRARTASR